MEVNMRKDISYVAVLGLILTGMIIGVLMVSEFNGTALSVANSALEQKLADQESQPGDSNPPQAAIGEVNWANVAEKAIPTVVSIYTSKEVTVQDFGSPFDFFFNDGRARPPRERKVPQKGLGSGVIVSADGYILTNNHVAGDADEINVRLFDKTDHKAKLVGKDPLTDLAVIKIETDEDLPFLKLGDSKKVRLGEPVLAVGNPLGLTSTVTSGIVSALGRNIRIIQSRYGIEDFIQTDAVINPGNSGGPLLNTRGEVIGINSAIQTTTGYYQGYGFAVPSDIAKNVMDEIIKYGRVKRGYIGIEITAVDGVVARGLGLDKPHGVLVNSVVKGMPAEKAGIKEGDVILSVNGEPVNEPNELQAVISSFNPGDRVELTVWRNKEKINLSVTLKEREDVSEPVAGNAVKKNEALAKLGIEVKNLTEKNKEALQTDHGLWFSNVDPNGQAAKRNLFPNAAILQLNSEDVKNVGDFLDKIGKTRPGDVLVFKIRAMNNNEIFDRLVFVDIPKE
jgi:Do/DeqQ family serine protease